MAYYMGDASAARHQGGLFSALKFVGKAIGRGVKAVATVAQALPLPFPASGIVRLAAGAKLSTVAKSAAAQGQLGSLPMQMFTPSAIPGVSPTAASNPIAAPISTPPVIIPQAATTKKVPRNTEAAKRLTVRAAPRRSARSSRRSLNAATRARLRRLGYDV